MTVEATTNKNMKLTRQEVNLIKLDGSVFEDINDGKDIIRFVF